MSRFKCRPQRDVRDAVVEQLNGGAAGSLTAFGPLPEQSLQGTPAEHAVEFQQARHDALDATQDAYEALHHGACRTALAHLSRAHEAVGRMHAHAYEVHEITDTARILNDIGKLDAAVVVACVRDQSVTEADFVRFRSIKPGLAGDGLGAVDRAKELQLLEQALAAKRVTRLPYQEPVERERSAKLNLRRSGHSSAEAAQLTEEYNQREQEYQSAPDEDAEYGTEDWGTDMFGRRVQGPNAAARARITRDPNQPVDVSDYAKLFGLGAEVERKLGRPRTAKQPDRGSAVDFSSMFLFENGDERAYAFKVKGAATARRKFNTFPLQLIDGTSRWEFIGVSGHPDDVGAEQDQYDVTVWYRKPGVTVRGPVVRRAAPVAMQKAAVAELEKAVEAVVEKEKEKEVEARPPRRDTTSREARALRAQQAQDQAYAAEQAARALDPEPAAGSPDRIAWLQREAARRAQTARSSATSKAQREQAQIERVAAIPHVTPEARAANEEAIDSGVAYEQRMLLDDRALYVVRPPLGMPWNASSNPRTTLEVTAAGAPYVTITLHGAPMRFKKLTLMHYYARPDVMFEGTLEHGVFVRGTMALAAMRKNATQWPANVSLRSAVHAVDFAVSNITLLQGISAWVSKLANAGLGRLGSVTNDEWANEPARDGSRDDRWQGYLFPLTGVVSGLGALSETCVELFHGSPASRLNLNESRRPVFFTPDRYIAARYASGSVMMTGRTPQTGPAIYSIRACPQRVFDARISAHVERFNERLKEARTSGNLKVRFTKPLDEGTLETRSGFPAFNYAWPLVNLLSDEFDAFLIDEGTQGWSMMFPPGRVPSWTETPL